MRCRRFQITNMTHGERYTIELDTESEAAEHKAVPSGRPLSAEHTVRTCRPPPAPPPPSSAAQ